MKRIGLAFACLGLALASCNLLPQKHDKDIVDDEIEAYEDDEYDYDDVDDYDDYVVEEYTDDEPVAPEEVARSIQGTHIDIVDDRDVVTEVRSAEDIVGTSDYDGVDDASRTAVKQEVEIVDERPQREITYDLANVQQKPEYPGGEAAMYEFMNHNIHYPLVAQEEGIQGTVVVQFTISKDGTITNAKVVRSPHESLSQEAIRLIMSMPKWTPGRNDGQPVNVNYTLPVRFKLSR